MDELDSKLTSINSSMRLELQAMTETPQHLNSGHVISNNSPGSDCGGTGWRRETASKASFNHRRRYVIEKGRIAIEEEGGSSLQTVQTSHIFLPS